MTQGRAERVRLGCRGRAVCAAMVSEHGASVTVAGSPAGGGRGPRGVGGAPGLGPARRGHPLVQRVAALDGCVSPSPGGDVGALVGARGCSDALGAQAGARCTEEPPLPPGPGREAPSPGAYV